MTTVMTDASARARPSAGAPRHPHWPRSDSLELGAYPSAVPSARLHVRTILAEWGLAELADDAESVAAELVGNGVAAHRREHLDAPLRITLLAGLRTVLIVVRDASSDPPVSRDPGDDAENGRGLLLVDAFSARWDSKPAPGGGKVVRAEIRGKPGSANCARRPSGARPVTGFAAWSPGPQTGEEMLLPSLRFQ
ncbi:MAG: ATP-binding protein [Nocardiopsaceae bacterium]|nr:ATP-binding protein [Nocardiopsaceae bacterium]